MATRSKSKSVSKRKEGRSASLGSGLLEKCPRECGTRHSKGGVCFKYPFKSPSSAMTSSSTVAAAASASSCTATSSSTTADPTVVKTVKDGIFDDIEVVSEEAEAGEDQLFDVDLENDAHHEESESEQTLALTESKAASTR